MDSDRILIGALIFIAIVIGANFLMFFIARSWAKSGDSRWMTALKDTLSKPTRDSGTNKSMDELRQRVQDLEDQKSKK